METLTLIQPDDWHVHLRDAEILNVVGKYTARVFRRAIVMPNLDPPITDVKACLAYCQQIQKAVDKPFTPLMTLYLTDATSQQTILEAKPNTDHYGFIYGAKLYPYAVTTNAEHGVRDPWALLPVFETMAEKNLPLLVHGEANAPEIDVYDREHIFIERILAPLREKLPSLKIVLEHITSELAIDFVLTSPNTAATITPHHLYYNRNALFENGLRPHRYCLPLAKRESDRLALVQAACSGDKHFFLGTDSAPHLLAEKQSACGCAGIFNALCAIETCAEIFEQQNALGQLENFVSRNGAQFYGLPLNTETITLQKQTWHIPQKISETCNGRSTTIVPFRANESISWKCLTSSTF